MSLPLPRLNSHALNAPTAGDIRNALRAVVAEGLDEVWAQACREADISTSAYLLALPDLEALTAALAAMPDPIGLTGRSQAVRVAAYKALSEVEGEEQRVAVDFGRASMEHLLKTRAPDPERMAELADLDLFSEATKTQLDRAARDGAEKFGAPVALVTVVLDGSQAFAGSHGLTGWMQEAQGTPVEWSLCATVVRTHEPYLVPDAVQDSLQRTNPMVARHHLGTYAGVPLITSRNQVVGAYCMIGGEPREFTEAELVELQAIAADIVAKLETRRLSLRVDQAEVISGDPADERPDGFQESA